jgi:CMP-N,N'-diacetyllegionaminic acid synthase
LSSNHASTLALVLARGGSKSIPRKNLAPLAGKPLIAWTIEAALRCPAAPRVVVSTDDEEIAAVARSLGAEAPFERPAGLAQDDTPTMPVVAHALRRLEDTEHYRPDRVLLLQPTSPLRTAEDITAALTLADERRAESVVSVGPASSHPHLLKRITEDGTLEDLMPHDPVKRRQDLEPVYALNGAIYLASREQLLKHESFYAKKTYAYVMPPERSIDVDTPWDLYLCDLILRDLHARG